MKSCHMVFHAADSVFGRGAVVNNERPIRTLGQEEFAHRLGEGPENEIGDSTGAVSGSERFHASAAFIDLGINPVGLPIEPRLKKSFMPPGFLLSKYGYVGI